MEWRAVTDKQWHKIEAHLPKRKRSQRGGRPPLSERQCFEGILWILWTGAPWSELPVVTPIALGAVSLLACFDHLGAVTVGTLNRNIDHRLPRRPMLMLAIGQENY